MNPEKMYRATRIPSALSVVDVILDTDAYNEVDDQYAIAYLLLLKNQFNVIGFTAAPFVNSLSASPEDGMNKSYDEILRILDLMKRSDLKDKVYRGSTRYLPDEKTPVESEAARYLVEQARLVRALTWITLGSISPAILYILGIIRSKPWEAV